MQGETPRQRANRIAQDIYDQTGWPGWIIVCDEWSSDSHYAYYDSRNDALSRIGRLNGQGYPVRGTVAYSGPAPIPDEWSLGTGVKIGYDVKRSPCCYPARPWHVQLPSGMRHHFRTKREAKRSQYWPHPA